jgi:hypothetical protein
MCLALVGCGKKDDSASTTTSDPPSKSSTSTDSSKDASKDAGKDASDMSGKVVGEWTMKVDQGNTSGEANISIREDGTFTNAGTLTSESPGADATVKMKMSYSIDGKWTMSGDKLESTPDKVDAKIEDLEIVAKDPANQAAMEGKKEELMKQAEEQGKASLNKPSSSKVVDATDDKLTLEGPDGTHIEYVKKK